MSSAVLKRPERPATEVDLLALPEQGRGYELIDGELLEKQAGFRHGRAQFNLAGLLSPYRRSGGGADRPGGWWFLTEQLVGFSPSQILRPDVVGWLRERLADGACAALFTTIDQGPLKLEATTRTDRHFFVPRTKNGEESFKVRGQRPLTGFMHKSLFSSAFSAPAGLRIRRFSVNVLCF